MTNRLNKWEKNVPWHLGEKISAYKFLDEIGVDHARLIGIFDSVEEVNFDELPHSFVIKPTREDSMRGVMVLQRRGGKFYDELRAKDISEQEVRDYFGNLFTVHAHKENKLIVEEYVRDADGFIVPRDFKFYAFKGEIALVLEINRNTRPIGVSWYDSQFAPVTDERVVVNTKFATHVPGRRPSGWREMAEVATEVSRQIPTPFASIDVYSSMRGPLVGEITLTPGAIYYGAYKLSEAMEKKMAAMWDIASDESRVFAKPVG